MGPSSKKPLSLKDYSITGEHFNIINCKDCGLLMTEFKDFENIGKYYEGSDYVSHKVNYINPIHIIYSLTRIYTTGSKEKMLNDILPDKSILDYGCGTGFLLGKLKQKGWKISGVEPDDDARKIASKNTGENIKDQLSKLNGSFAGITLWHVLEHTLNPAETIASLIGFLKPKGKIVVAVPNYLSFDATHYLDFWAGYDVPRHLWHFTRKSMEKLANANNLKVEKIIPMHLDAFYVSLLSEKYKSGKHSIKTILNAIKIGMKSNKEARTTGEYSSLIYILKK